MRFLLQLVVGLLAAATAFSLDITTRDGTTYRKAQVTAVDPDGLHITHSRGVAKVPFEDLPDALQKQYHYDPAKVAAYRRAVEETNNVAAVRAAAAQRERDQITLRAQEDARRQADERRRQEDEKLTADERRSGATPIPRRQGSVKTKMEQATYLVKTDRAQGSAFLVRMGGSSYLVSNYHVLKGAKTAEFSNAGDSLSLEQSSSVEIATDRDLVRIPVARDAELVAAEAPSLNLTVNVYGNPGGQEVITQESGKLLGIGPVNIEVSAEFIPGNSGGPIIQADTGNVLGVAAFLMRHTDMEKWITNKTRFEEARRFGVRLDDSIRWSRTSWSNLCFDTALIASVDSFLDDAIALTRLLATNPYRTPFASRVVWGNELERMRTRQVYEGIVAKYNGACNEYAWALDKPIHSGQLRQINELFEQRVRGQASNLGRCLQEASVEWVRWAGVMHHFSTEQTRKDYQNNMDEIGKFGVFVEKVSGDIANKNMFQLAPRSSP